MFSVPQKRLLKRKDSFEQFQESTRDAWDAADDELTLRVRPPADAALRRRPSLGLVVLQDSAPGAAANILPSASSSPALLEGIEQSPRSRVVDIPVVRENISEAAPASTAPSPASSLAPATMTSASTAAAAFVAAAAATPAVVEVDTQFTREQRAESAKVARLTSLLQVGGGPASNPTIDLAELKQISWSGVPGRMRPLVWKLLSGYLPAVTERQAATLERKRREYFGFVEQYYGTRLHPEHQDTFRQIRIDIPRTSPSLPFLQDALVQEIFERILYIWAIRHPASGYVQGMNDLVTPFFVAFMTEYTDTCIDGNTSLLPSLCVLLSTDQQRALEADCFWCLSKLLDGVHDNYVFAQPGIQKKVLLLKELVTKSDGGALCRHLETVGVEFLQFSFRWMNNLLLRELPLCCCLQLWDTYQAETDGFANFHLYVCAAFLLMFASQLLKEMEFQGLMTLLQNLPTEQWGESEMRELVAKAYQLKCTYTMETLVQQQQTPSKLPSFMV